jgi:NADH dehydrogenase FAD-containing subunit
VEFFQGWADDVDFSGKRVFVEEAAIQRNEALALTDDGGDGGGGGGGGARDGSCGTGYGVRRGRGKGKVFGIGYDKLVVAVGCYSQTFGTKGVRENALFLKDVGDARKIRKRILDCESREIRGLMGVS